MNSQQNISGQPFSRSGRSKDSLSYEIKGELYHLEPNYHPKKGSEKEGTKEKHDPSLKKNERFDEEFLSQNQEEVASGVGVPARERRLTEMMKNKKVSPESQKLLQRLQKLKREMKKQNEMGMTDKYTEEQIDEDSLMHFKQENALGRNKEDEEIKNMGGILPQNSARQSASDESEEPAMRQIELDIANPLKQSEYYNCNKKMSEFQRDKQTLIIQNQIISAKLKQSLDKNQQMLKQERQKREKVEDKNEQLLIRLNNLVRQNQTLKQQLNHQKQEKGNQSNPDQNTLKNLANDPRTIRVNSNSTDQSNVEEGPGQKLLNRLQQLKLLLKQRSSQEDQADQKTTQI